MNIRHEKNIELAGLRQTDNLRAYLKKHGPMDAYVEEKLDGHRYSFQFGNGEIHLTGRNREMAGHGVAAAGEFKTRASPLWMRNLANVSRLVVLDGEVLPGEGAQAANKVSRVEDWENVRYRAFDILMYDGHDLRNEPIFVRKKWLQTVRQSVVGMELPRLEFHDYGKVINFGLRQVDELVERAGKSEVEGFVVKPLDWPYGVNVGWKVKPVFKAIGQIVSAEEGKRHHLGEVHASGDIGSLHVRLDGIDGYLPVGKLRIPMSEARMWVCRMVEFEHSGIDRENKMFRFPQYVRLR